MEVPKCPFLLTLIFLFTFPSLPRANYHKHFLNSLEERYDTILNTGADLARLLAHSFRWPPIDDSGNIPFLASTDTPHTLRTKINLMLGPIPQPGEFPKAGYIFTMVQAYKIVLYDDKLISIFRDFASLWRVKESNARNHQRIIEEVLWNLYLVKDNCTAEVVPFTTRLTELVPVNGSLQTANFTRTMEELEGIQDQLKATCLNFPEGDREVVLADHSLAHNLLEGYTSALYLFGYVAHLSTNYDGHTIQGRQARYPLSPFTKMLLDTDSLMEQIELNMIALKNNSNNLSYSLGERIYFDNKFREFERLLLHRLPYNRISGYTGVPPGVRQRLGFQRASTLFYGMRQGWQMVPGFSNFTSGVPGYLQEIYPIYDTDVRTTYSGENATQLWGMTNAVYNNLAIAYHTFLAVREINQTTPNRFGFDWDDEENWWFNLNAPVQGMRLAWNYLDRVVEEQNCYLRKLYWQDLRNETLAKTQYQRKKVFSHISKTLLMPCKPHDDDMVGFCTGDNYEICRPAHMSEDQISHVEDTGDLAFFQPKWVFTRTEEQPGDITTTKCTGKLTYIPLYFVCRCGFKDDCGDDFNSHLTCVLQANDMFRKQCKGSIGYPCKSLPFAPGKHDESCMTGYCDRKLNSCEEDERYYPDYTGDPRRWLSTNEAGETNRILRFDKLNERKRK